MLIIIQVGTAYELEERLKEDPNTILPKSQPSYPLDVLVESMHAFDISESKEINKLWTDAVKERKYRFHPASVFGQPTHDYSGLSQLPNNSHQGCTEPSRLDAAENRKPETLPANGIDADEDKAVSSGSLTPVGQRQAQRAAKTLSHASRISPDLASPHTHNRQARSRWEAYGAISGQFADKSNAMPANTLTPSSLPSAPADQSLLSLFHDELAKLTHVEGKSGATNVLPPKGVVDSVRSVVTADGQTQTPRPGQHSVDASTAPIVVGVQNVSTQTRPILRQPAAEAINSSLKSLFEGVGLLAASVLEKNPEIHRGFREAQEEFPRNVEKAVEASAAAIQFLGTNLTSSLQGTTNVSPSQNVVPGSSGFQANLESGASSPLRCNMSTAGKKDTLPDVTEKANFTTSPKSSPARTITSVVPIADDTHGRLTWHSNGDSVGAHDVKCLDACKAPICPVRNAIRRAYKKITYDDETAASVAHDVNDEIPVNLQIKQDTTREAPKVRFVPDPAASSGRNRADNSIPVWAQASRACSKNTVDPHPLLSSKPSEQDSTGNSGNGNTKSQTSPAWTIPENVEPSLKYSPAAVKAIYPPSPSIEDDPEDRPMSTPIRARDRGIDLEAARLKESQDPYHEKEVAQQAWADRHSAAKSIPTDNRLPGRYGLKREDEDVSLPSGPDLSAAVQSAPISRIEHDKELYGPPSPQIAAGVPVQSDLHHTADDVKPSFIPLRHSKSVGFKDTSVPRYNTANVTTPLVPRGNLASRIEERERRPYSYAPTMSETEPSMQRREHDATASSSGSSSSRAKLPAGFRQRNSIAHMPSMPDLSRRPADSAAKESPNVRSDKDRRTANIAHCTSRLREMGFGRRESATVAESVAGDLESAIDVLEEDRRARDEVQRKRHKERREYQHREYEKKIAQARAEAHDRETRREQRERERATRPRRHPTWGPGDFLGAAGDLIGAIADGATGQASGSGSNSGSGPRTGGSDTTPAARRFPDVPGAFPGAVQDIFQASGLFGQPDGQDRRHERSNEANGRDGTDGPRRTRWRDGEWW